MERNILKTTRNRLKKMTFHFNWIVEGEKAMTLREWVATMMAKRVNRVLNKKLAWEMLDYTFFEEENERQWFFKSKEESDTWRKKYNKDFLAILDKLMTQNGITEEEIKSMSYDELDLLVINNMAEDILLKMPKEVEWEEPIVWTMERLKKTELGNYLK